MEIRKKTPSLWTLKVIGGVVVKYLVTKQINIVSVHIVDPETGIAFYKTSFDIDDDGNLDKSDPSKYEGCWISIDFVEYKLTGLTILNDIIFK